MNRREEIEKQEEQRLASYACTAKGSLGREKQEEQDEYRTIFQRDRDRIIHTKAYRRLQGKTQVFMVGEGDHYRNRLTHTNEVTQISRDLARALNINEDLAESIALAHDLGHTPFGHAGQDALDEMMRRFGKRFEHNQQSFHIVHHLESPYPFFQGLNLSREVLEGIAKHTSIYDQDGLKHSVGTLEAQVVNLADEIAYHHHDLDDGLRAGLITIHDMKRLTLIQNGMEKVEEEYGHRLSGEHYIKRLLTIIIKAVIHDCIQATQQAIHDHHVQTIRDVALSDIRIACFSPKISLQIEEIAHYLYHEVYMSSHIKRQADEAKTIIQQLFDHFYEKRDALSQADQARIALGESAEDVIKDHIAGMTDHFAIDQYMMIYPRKKIRAIQLQLISD